ncbi:hypothetical protein, partial [Salmonella sp. s54412]
ASLEEKVNLDNADILAQGVHPVILARLVMMVTLDHPEHRVIRERQVTLENVEMSVMWVHLVQLV